MKTTLDDSVESANGPVPEGHVRIYCQTSKPAPCLIDVPERYVNPTPLRGTVFPVHIANSEYRDMQVNCAGPYIDECGWFWKNREENLRAHSTDRDGS